MLEKKAVIDIGTNAFHLLIATVDADNQINSIFKNTIPVKLGEGGVNKGFITPEAYKRGIDALVSFRKSLDEFDCHLVKATATAAVRDASNGEAFIDEALKKASIKIDIIDGLKEADYIYEGAKGAGVLNSETGLIMDIGGGSVEFIICNRQQIFWKKSYLLGAARLLADYYEQDNAIAIGTITTMETAFQTTLADLKVAIKEFKPLTLIGTAGSFDSYANITAVRKNQTFDAHHIKSVNQNANEFHNLLAEIIGSTHSERLNIEGLIPLRTDMILMASILTRYVLKMSGINSIVTCTYSLKEGLLLSKE